MEKKHPLYFTIHGHFYQPPRENPWTGVIENQPSARPFHDWNDRIASQCYSPNSASRILNSEGRIQDIVNNYDFMSFNMGPTLMGWIRTHTPDTYKRIQEADKRSAERLNGHGNAIAQVYNHIIMPLASEQDKRTQILWGIEDFKFHFGRMPEAMWLAETAINLPTVVELIKAGIKFTILSPTQAESFRELGAEEWIGCSNTDIDTTRPYRIYPRDEKGNLVCDGYLDVFFYNPWLSSAVGFEHLLRNAGVFGKRIQDAWDPNREDPQLVSIGTDGESYGHHEPFGDMCAAYLYNRFAPENNMVPVNYGWYLEKFPPKHEVLLKNFHGEGQGLRVLHRRWPRLESEMARTLARRLQPPEGTGRRNLCAGIREGEQGETLGRPERIRAGIGRSRRRNPPLCIPEDYPEQSRKCRRKRQGRASSGNPEVLPVQLYQLRLVLQRHRRPGTCAEHALRTPGHGTDAAVPPLRTLHREPFHEHSRPGHQQ